MNATAFYCRVIRELNSGHFPDPVVRKTRHNVLRVLRSGLLGKSSENDAESFLRIVKWIKSLDQSERNILFQHFMHVRAEVCKLVDQQSTVGICCHCVAFVCCFKGMYYCAGKGF